MQPNFKEYCKKNLSVLKKFKLFVLCSVPFKVSLCFNLRVILKTNLLELNFYLPDFSPRGLI